MALPSAYELFLLMRDKKASDLHITVGAPPLIRVDGQITPTPFDSLTPETSQTLVYSLLTEAQRKKFEANNELDAAFGFREVGRLRINVFRQRGSVAASIRAVPAYFRSFEELGLPPVVRDLVMYPSGLILVTGPTGSGKSTTLATMLDSINSTRNGHIITVEDPIEYVHAHKKCVVNQREVGMDTDSFPAALKHILREDPNVILIGEMRDMETMSAALTLAETGHMVFATLHTPDCAQAINRIIDAFPPYQISQVRAQLSFVLQAILSQQLLTRAGGRGRALAVEVLIVTSAIRNIIREHKIEQIQFSIQTGANFGMQTMNQSLAELYRRKVITYQTAMSRTHDPEDLRRVFEKLAVAVPPSGNGEKR